MSNSRIPSLPEIPLSARKGSGNTPRVSPPSPRTSPRTMMHGTGMMSGRTIVTGANGAPIVLSSTSRTKYVLAQPPSSNGMGTLNFAVMNSQRSGGTSLPPVSPRNQQHQKQITDGKGDSNTAGTLTVVAGGELVEVDQQQQGTNGQLQTYVPASLTAAGGAAATTSTAASPMLSRHDLRGIDNLVTFNSKLRHTHRLKNAADAIPSLTFAMRLKGPCDDLVGLQVAPINPQESALDVVLRLTSPEELRVPALSDQKTNLPLSTRLVALLKGTTSVPVHWAGEKEGVEKDHAHVQAMRDAKVRIEAAKRQDHPYNEAKARCCMAALQYNSHNMEGVIKTLTPAVALFEDCGHASGLAFVHSVLGVSYYHNGEFKMALIHFRKLEALCGAYGKAVARINMGVCYAALEEPQFAQQAFTDAVASALEAQEPVLETISVGNRGLAFMRLGQMKAAQTELEACLEHCSVAGDHVGTVVVLLLLGQNSAACKDYQQAIFYYEHGMRVAEQANCPPLVAMAKVSVGVCRGQSESKGQLMATASNMGKPLSVADVVKTMAIRE